MTDGKADLGKEIPREFAARLFGCRPEEIADDASIQNQAGWDSFAHLDLMMFLAERYGIEITEETIQRYAVWGEIEALHREHSRG